MTLPIRQHYLPQWLQYNFVERYSPAGQIWVHDLDQERSFQQAPRNVGYERDLYTLDQEYGDKKELYVIETIANDKFDGDGSSIVKAIRKTGRLPDIGTDHYSALLGVVAWQTMRTPAKMEQIVTLTEKFHGVALEEMRSRPDLFAEAKAAMYKDSDDPFIREYSFEDFQRSTSPELMKLNIPKNHIVTQALNMAEKLNDLFIHRDWHLLVAKGDERFVLGDNPVVPISRTGHGSLGSPDSFIVLPITQRLALAGVADNRFGFQNVHPLQRSKVAMINRAMIGQAKRWIFSTEKTFYHHDGHRVEKSSSFFHWRNKVKKEAEAVGRSLHMTAMPDSYWDDTAKAMFPKPN